MSNKANRIIHKYVYIQILRSTKVPTSDTIIPMYVYARKSHQGLFK
jgi:hypothetical protein